MFFVAALVICLVIKFRFPKGKSIARINDLNFRKNIKLSNGYHIYGNIVYYSEIYSINFTLFCDF